MAKKPTVAQYINAQIEASGKTNAEIATALGYSVDRANMISMIRTGRSKLPIDKVGLIARVLGIDPSNLLRRVFGEYSPSMLLAIEDALGGHLLTEGEQEVLGVMRKEAGDQAIHLLDNQLVTIQGWARDAAKIANEEHRRNFAKAKKNWRTDRSDAVSTPMSPGSRSMKTA